MLCFLQMRSPDHPLVVLETVETDSGGVFFILGPETAPAEDGSKADGEMDGEEKAEAEAFMTETPEQKPDKQSEEETPKYIENVDIPSDVLKEIKDW